MSALAKNYNRRKIAFKRGKGSFLYSTNGTRYLDFVQGIAVNSLGHANPYLIKEMNKQANKVWHVSNSFLIPEGEKLAKRLTQKTFADYVMFQNSGTEATEAAIKVARRYFYSIGKPKKNRILCVKNSFHGRTLAAIYASGSKKMTEGFGPKVDGFDHFEFGNHKSLKKAINKNTAGIICEVIQGEGGIRLIPDYCLKGLRELCDEHGILLIFDEVQTFCRSNAMFAFEKSGITPDIVPIAKGIGGGFPLGACLVTKKVSVGMTPGTHGSTFGGNELACAVGNALCDIILEKDFFKKMGEKSEYFDKGLKKIKDKYPKIIEEIRGVGLIIGLKMSVDNEEFIKKLMNHKMLVIKASDNVIRLFPPLIVNNNELDEAISKIEKVCKEMS